MQTALEASYEIMQKVVETKEPHIIAETRYKTNHWKNYS
jgi:hypothetical protein